MSEHKRAEKLQLLLANIYALYIKTQNYHWNVTGPFFPQLHAMFERQYEQLAESIDTVAEKIRQLDSKVPASLSIFAKNTKLADGDETSHYETMITDLIADNKTICKEIYSIIEVCEKDGDETTTDMLVDILSSLEKEIWMMNSCL